MAKKSSASGAGFHFYNLYQCCPRKFYLRFVCGLAEKETPASLVFGAAFHEGKAAFYRTHSPERGNNCARRYVQANGGDTALVLRVTALLNAWYAKFGYADLRKYEFVSIEQEMTIYLLNDFVFTGRPDAVVRSKFDPDSYIILETKTSGTSRELTEQSVRFGDQATSYAALVSAVLGIPAETLAIQPDIAYWNRKASLESNIDCYRPESFCRTENDIVEFRNSVGQVYSEMSQKIAALPAHDPVQLFPRNTYYCMSFFKPCIYADICRLKIGLKHRPVGFRKCRPYDLNAVAADELALQ